MNYQAFDQFDFDESEEEEEKEEEEISSPDLSKTLTPEIERKSDKILQKNPIGYYTHSLKPSVKKTILTSDDFIPMAITKIEKGNKVKSVNGNGKKIEKNQSKKKEQSKVKITKENQNKKQSSNSKSNNSSTKVKSRKETTPKKVSSSKVVKTTSKSQPFDILHNINNSGIGPKTKIVQEKKKKIIPKKVQSNIKNWGKKSQLEKNLEKQLKNTVEALVQNTIRRFLKFN